jgi:DNA polymerase/3'-5' exonuclease PolX
VTPSIDGGAATAHDTSFNRAAAEILRHCAELLRQQRANPFRVNAYLRAAKTLDTLPIDAREILRVSGIKGLLELPHIGAGLAGAIDEIARTGTLAQLDRLRGSADPETLLRVVPGIGPTLARAIHDELQIDSLEELEVAARSLIYFYDGDHREGQHTVVTETHGPFAGRRVVRGREAESVART